MTGVRINNYSNKETYEVISDTGSALMAGPSDVVAKLADAVGAQYNREIDLYTIDCDKKIDPLILTIGAVDYSIKYDNFIFPEPELKTCIIGIQNRNGMGYGPSWVLGIPFIMSHCQIYDIGQKRIGFAQPKQGV